jgi:hypothetical protein
MIDSEAQCPRCGEMVSGVAADEDLVRRAEVPEAYIERLKKERDNLALALWELLRPEILRIQEEVGHLQVSKLSQGRRAEKT